MASVFIEALENAGLLKGNSVAKDRIANAPLKDLMLVAEQSLEFTSAANQRPEVSAFTHSAPESLSGAPHPCSSLQCRLAHVNSLARFAALYSDRVYIRNSLMRYFDHADQHSPPETKLRQALRNDLAVIAELRPLIEAGQVVPVTPPGDRCPRCLWERDRESAERFRLRSALREVRREFRKNVKIRLQKLGHQYQFMLEGPTDILEHAIYRSAGTLPSEIEGNASVRRALEAGRSVWLQGYPRRATGIDDMLAGRVLTDVIFETVLAQVLGTSFLTDRPVHLRVLSALGESSVQDRRNQILQEHFTSIVPFAGDVPVANLMDLRRREEESFILFRHQLTRAVDELSRMPGAVTRRRAIELYADVVQPALAGIDRKVNLAKRDLRNSALRRAATWVGVIGIGSYTGIVPAGLQALAGVLGLGKVAQETAEMIAGKADVEARVRGDPYYFLWQVRQVSHDIARRDKRLSGNGAGAEGRESSRLSPMG